MSELRFEEVKDEHHRTTLIYLYKGDEVVATDAVSDVELSMFDHMRGYSGIAHIGAVKTRMKQDYLKAKAERKGR